MDGSRVEEMILTGRIDDHLAAMTELRNSFSDSDQSLRQLTAKVDQVLAHSTADRDASPATDTLLAELRDAARDHDGTIASLTSRIDDHLYAVVSVNAFEGVDPSLLSRAPANFDGEGTDSRLARRKRNWIANVEFLERGS